MPVMLELCFCSFLVFSITSVIKLGGGYGPICTESFIQLVRLSMLVGIW